MGRTYGDAESAVDLRIYFRFKRTVALRTVLIVVPGSLILAVWAVRPAVALAVGALCGLGNMVLGMRGNERLVEARNVGIFVLSSFLRIGLFGIVAAALAAWGPLWSLGTYFAGFFLPLGLYAGGVRHAFEPRVK